MIISSIIFLDTGQIEYYVGDKLHCLTGPAIIHKDGCKEWFYYGTKAEVSSQQEFEKWVS